MHIAILPNLATTEILYNIHDSLLTIASLLIKLSNALEVDASSSLGQ
jgi:hypothetical protein